MADAGAGGYSRAAWAALALLGAAVAVTLFFATQIRSRAEQVADALEAAPRVAIADFPATGYARIEGRVRLLRSALVAPLSGRRCVYYEIDVEVEGRAGDGGAARRRASRAHDFALDDPTGAAVVRLHRALVAVDEAHCQSGILAELPPRQRAALAVEEDLGHLDGIDPGAVRVRECVVPADARVAVAGVASSGRAGSAGLILGNAQAPIYVGVMTAGE